MNQTRISNIEYRISKTIPHRFSHAVGLIAHYMGCASRVTRHASRVLLIVALIALFACSSGWAQTGPRKSVPLDKRIADLEAEVGRLRQEVNMYTLDGLPDNLILCDKKIPIFREDVRERFEREFFQLLENKGLLTIVIKRYFKYLNFITEETKRMAVPSDLIYLVDHGKLPEPEGSFQSQRCRLMAVHQRNGKKRRAFRQRLY